MPVQETRGVQIPLDSVQYKVLQVALVPQGNYQNLCWAACCAMLLNAGNFPDTPTTLEDAAALAFPPGADDGQDPGDALGNCQISPFTSALEALKDSSVNETFLVNCLAAGQPVEIWWLFDEDRTRGHVSLVIGYAPYQGTTMFCVADSLFDEDYWLTWQQLQTYDNSMVTHDTFYEIGPALQFSP